jgi:transposase
MTGIETANLSARNPEAYLADLLGRIREHDQARLDDLLP